MAGSPATFANKFKSIALIYDRVFDSSKDIVITIDYTAYSTSQNLVSGFAPSNIHGGYYYSTINGFTVGEQYSYTIGNEICLAKAKGSKIIQAPYAKDRISPGIFTATQSSYYLTFPGPIGSNILMTAGIYRLTPTAIPSGGFVVGFVPSYCKSLSGTSHSAGLGYSNVIGTNATGVLSAQYGIGFDFSGKFSSSTTGVSGLNYTSPNTIAIRGPAIDQYPLLTVSPNLSTLSTPVTLYSPATAIELKRIRTRLTGLGSRFIVDIKSPSTDVYINILDYSTTYQAPSAMRVYCAFCCDNTTGILSAWIGNTTHIEVQNININGYTLSGY